MAKNSHIGWTNDTWNPWGHACTKISQGCKNCYMFAHAKKYGEPDPATQAFVWRERADGELRSFGPGRVIFVNSMSDTYHENAPYQLILRIHQAAVAHPDKVFLLLTKRPHRALALADRLPWPDNIWVGTSIENDAVSGRLDDLLKLPTDNLFVSCEPLLGQVDILGFYLRPDPQTGKHLRWVIAGGESGLDRRPLNKNWIRTIRNFCQAFDVPFFYKQGSDIFAGNDRLLDGREWNETPDWAEYYTLPAQQLSLF